MKKNGLLLLAAVLCSTSLFAQRNAGDAWQGRQVEKMKTELALTDDQVARLAKANEEFRQNHARVFRDTSMTRKDMMIKGRELAEGREKSIKEILTKDQYEKWMNSKPAVRRAGPAPHQSRTGVEEMKAELGLSDDQVAKIKTINGAMMKQFRALRADSTLTREDRMKSQKRIMDERRTSIKKVLTEEQYEKFLTFEKQKIRGPQDRHRGRRR